MKAINSFKWSIISTSGLWIVFFSIVPLGLLLLSSVLTADPSELIRWKFTLSNYKEALDPLYIKVFLRSFLLAGTATLLCLLMAYPFAYLIARVSSRWRALALLFVIIPFWTSTLVRTYAMIAILKAKGVINNALLALGLISHPIAMLYTNTAVIIALVYDLLPFMILPLYVALERFDESLIEAGKDLGASAFTIFRRIIIPVSMPGIIAGCVMVFLPAMTIFYIPSVVGGARSMLLGNLIQDEFLIAGNWPLGSALSVLLMLLMLLGLLSYRRYQQRSGQESVL